MNAGSIVGRLVPTALADRLGVYNIMIPSMIMSAAVLFGIFGVHDGPGAVVVAAFFGFSTGACKSFDMRLLGHTRFRVHPAHMPDADTLCLIDISLIPSLLAMMCKELSELGYVFSI